MFSRYMNIYTSQVALDLASRECIDGELGMNLGVNWPAF